MQKHTEGGDFRQATYRAVRHGLKRTKSLLLEPVYEFSLEIPQDAVGRALNDLQKMQASFSQPVTEGEMAVITGSAPVVNMRDYQREVVAYSRGEGRLFCSLKGYEPCHNAEAVIAEAGYDSERDLNNPTGSVFCAHGAGFNVNWEEVVNYMHLDFAWQQSAVPLQATSAPGVFGMGSSAGKPARSGGSLVTSLEADKELEEIFTRTYGAARRTRDAFRPSSSSKSRETAETEKTTEYLLVDGYNIIFAWEELSELAKVDLAAARLALMDILSNYQGYRGNVLILVFDAYKVEGYQGEVQKYHNIYVVYTKEAETADQYIEKTVLQIERRHRVTVATSDGIEQLIIMGQGALRMSAQGLKEDIMATNQEIRKDYLTKQQSMRSYLFQNVSDELADMLEDVRLGKKVLNKDEKGK